MAGYNNAKSNARHKEFQFGTNPMQMSEFEKSEAEKEKKERKDAREEYIKGVQGRDGGFFKSHRTEAESKGAL